MKKFALLSLMACLCLIGKSQVQGPFTTQKAAACLDTFAKLLPTEKLYLQTDRTIYRPGEQIWFSGVVTNRANQIVKEVSDLIQVQLIGPSGRIVTETMSTVLGTSISLSKSLAGGRYVLKAFTPWMIHQDSTLYFEKEIFIQKVVLGEVLLKLDFERESYGAGQEVLATFSARTKSDLPLTKHPINIKIKLNGKTAKEWTAETDQEGELVLAYDLPPDLVGSDGLLILSLDHEGQTESISRSIPISNKNIQIDFLPEGGALLAGFTNKVAFKALQDSGLPADVEGYIVNAQGERVCTFSSYHQGMGAFELIPQLDQNYQAIITHPTGTVGPHFLPKVMQKGIGGSVEQREDGLQVTIQSQTADSAHIIVQVQGQVFYQHTLQLEENSTTLFLPTKEWPMGIAQVNIFDKWGRPHFERLAFVNYGRELQVEIQTDKQKYQPRELVQMKVKVKDDAGQPVRGEFTLAVVDDNLLTFADDKQDNILSHFLMSSELKGKVYEPNFYFNPEEPKAQKALDYVLMTHGWRGFVWQELLETPIAVWQHQSNKLDDLEGLEGTVFLEGRRLKGVTVKIAGQPIETKTNDSGVFFFSSRDIHLPVTVVVSHRGGKDRHYFNTYNKKYLGKPNRGNTLETISQVEVEGNFFQSIAVPNQIDEGQSLAAKQDLNGAVVALNGSAEGLRISRSALSEVVVVGYGVSARNSYAGYGMEVDLDFEPMKLWIRPTRSNPSYRYQRRFYAPRYRQKRKPRVRSDFRKTIFWRSGIKTDVKGEASLFFHVSDEITVFRATLEGATSDGLLGRGTTTFYSQLPFTLQAKTPEFLMGGDTLYQEVIIKNNTGEEVRGNLNLGQLSLLKLANNALKNVAIQIPARNHWKGKIPLIAKDLDGMAHFKVSFTTDDGLTEAIPKQIQLRSRGFPYHFALSGGARSKQATFQIKDTIPGSLEAHFKYYPDFIRELIEGMEGMLREPHGCFEQVSSSNFPNILVLQLLQETGRDNPKLKLKAKNLLRNGYQKLAKYETKEGGFEWYGRTPPHVFLTAYGLLQFHEMKKVFSGVDASMVKRTKDWLMNLQDLKSGQFRARKNAYYASNNTWLENMHAYILYVLSEVGQQGLHKALDFSLRITEQTEDPYFLALTSIACQNMGRKEEATRLLERLKEHLRTAGLDYLKESSTPLRSYGSSKQVQVAAYVVIALMREEELNHDHLGDLISFIRSHKRGSGTFGSTQTTITALMAINEFVRKTSNESTEGTLEIQINDTLISMEMEEIKGNGSINENLKKHLRLGENTIAIRFSDEVDPGPYTFAANWNASSPERHEDCRVKIETKYNTNSLEVGGFVRLQTRLINTSDEALPSTIALVGVPGGLSLQTWQLEELVDKGQIDYYEIRDEYLVLYLDGLPPSANLLLNLDLKAEVPGQFRAFPSSAYLYYTDEYKDWTQLPALTINP
ncbi:MAG: hypothetical protein KTR30_04970 [Saprospiraceae bacterium]|nr:hypothetical protein [Saprospiraceae bacterium]